MFVRQSRKGVFAFTTWKSTRLIRVLTITNELNVYSPDLYSVNIYIIRCGVLIYKVLSVTYSRLLRSTYIDYNAIEFLRYIAFSGNIRKQVLFPVYKVCYRRVFGRN
jgi:hypothetical protein